MYGYLTGIAVLSDEKEESLYVVSSDGFGSKSFMPSTIWKIPISQSSTVPKRSSSSSYEMGWAGLRPGTDYDYNKYVIDIQSK